LEGKVVSKEPKQGGHLMMTLRLEDASMEECWVYEPSGDLRRIANFLAVGDAVRISGGVRRGSPLHGRVVNVERIEVLSISREAGNGRRMGSGAYLPSPRAQRHLTKQLVRYGNEVLIGHSLVEGWLSEGDSKASTFDAKSERNVAAAVRI
jgi:tRNA(Ile2) C34 agmatinyltransferase TiaS